MAQPVCPLCGTAQKRKSYYGEYQRCAGCLRIIKLSDMKLLDEKTYGEETTTAREHDTRM